jgi:hypothetical protein
MYSTNNASRKTKYLYNLKKEEVPLKNMAEMLTTNI